MNILFLDIDGVLNSARSIATIGISQASDPNFDPLAVHLVRRLCEECDLHVYIHSSWTKRNNTDYFRRTFNTYGVDLKILDLLPYEDNRVRRIDSGIFTYKPDKYVILDDYDLHKDFRSDAICVDNLNEFSYQDYMKALSLFGKKSPLILF